MNAGMDIKFADMKADMNIKFTDMNTKFAEQSGKMKVIQYQLGTVITLVTVIGGVSIFTRNLFVTAVLTDCSSSLDSRLRREWMYSLRKMQRWLR